MKNTLVCSIFAVAFTLSAYAHEIPPPEAVGKIQDQTIFVPNSNCGPMSLNFDVTPFFNGHGQPLTYCLSHLSIDGDASNLTVTLNPFTGILGIPVGWFGVNTTVNVRVFAKNAYGSASQNMKIFLEPCGG